MRPLDDDTAWPTPERSLRIAVTLFQDGACDEAYAVLVHALSLDTGDSLTTELLVAAPAAGARRSRGGCRGAR